MKFLISIILIFTLGCDDKITESETQVVDRPTACPSPNPELEASEYSFAGIQSVDSINRTSAVVTWESNSNFENYFVISVGSVDRKIIGTASSGDTELTIRGLTPNTNYRLLVRAIDRKGFMEPNDKTISFTTLPWPNFSNLKSLKFNGSQAVQLGESRKFDLSQSFTISTWVKKLDVADSDQRVFTFHRKNKASSALSLGFKKDKVKLNYQNSDDQSMTFDLESEYADNKWHQFVLVNDQEFIKVYVDGVLLFKLKDKLEGVTGMHQAHIGSFTGIQKGLQGQIDEFAFFQTAFLDSDVTELFDTGVAYDLRDHSKSQFLKHWYRFGDSASDNSSMIEDVAGAQNAVPFNITESDFSNDSP